MTKRLLSLLLAIILIFSITGCAASKDDTKPTDSSVETETVTNPSEETTDNTQADETTDETTTETKNPTEESTDPTTETTTPKEETTTDKETNKETNKDTNKNNTTETESKNEQGTTATTDRVVVKDEDSTSVSQTAYTNVGLQIFDSKMISYMEKTFGVTENTFMSPLSLKYTLAMAAIGSSGKTQQEILQVLGFKSVDECENWAKSYMDSVKSLDNLKTDDEQSGMIGGFVSSTGGGPTTLNIANSVWHNTNQGGKIKTTFANAINKACGAEVFNVSSDKLKNQMNEWVSKETNGMIKNMFDDSVGSKNTILVNALYLKANWTNEFAKNSTHKDDFTCANGKVVQKDFMVNYKCRFQYYKDKETELVVIPLKDGIKMLAVKGSTENIATKLSKAEVTYMDLYFPKFEMESKFDKKELVEFLKANGAKTMFTSSADFSKMIDTGVFIDDIVQNAKIEVDEEGLEASAVTSSTALGSAGGKVEEPIIVKFDKAFKFYVYNYNADGTTPEVLFYGNYAK